MIQGIILLGLAAFMWFSVVQNPTEESATGFVLIFKKIFGMKGYIIMGKVLTVFLILAAIAEFYKYFVETPIQ
jgi:hypothetical protein